MELLVKFVHDARCLKSSQPVPKCGALSAKKIVTFFFTQGHFLLSSWGPARLHAPRKECLFQGHMKVSYWSAATLPKSSKISRPWHVKCAPRLLVE